jgi:hypothetical protein
MCEESMNYAEQCFFRKDRVQLSELYKQKPNEQIKLQRSEGALVLTFYVTYSYMLPLWTRNPLFSEAYSVCGP